jgi:transcriptional regulator with XRE-family HTH domain
MRPFRAKPVDLARQRVRELLTYFGRELRIARVTAGLTQEQVARRAGLTQEYVSAVERAAAAPAWEAACRLATAVGTDLSLRLFPTGSVSLRDSGQLALAEVLVSEADRSWRARMEVSVGNGRAHDLVLDRPEEVAAIEIERLFADMQGQTRQGQIKRDALAQHESRPVRLIIAVPDTRAMRQLVREHADYLHRIFPVASRAIWRAIRQGTPIGGDGILFIPHPRKRRERDS